ncbi:MAG: hypothetical protein JNN32_00535 [Flavobacteriales bacterium]|nr:hypothetical protein [Flavobacteriales bacterium]
MRNMLLSEQRLQWVFPGALVLIALGVYFNSLSCGLFPWDDQEYIQAAADAIWAPRKASFFVMGNFHPLSLLTLSLDFWIGEGSAPYFHLTNTVLHGINAALVYQLCSKLRLARHNASIVSLIFVIHPIHVESVAWISERKNVLYVFFYLAACLRYWNHLKNPSRWIILQVLILYTAALLSKAQAVTFPVACFGLVLLHEGLANWRQRLKQLLPLMTIAVIIGITAVVAQEAGGYLHWDRSTIKGSNFLLPPIVFMTLVRRIILPYDLSVIHPLLAIDPVVLVISAVLSVILLLATISMIRKKQYTIPAVIVFYTAAVLPILQIVPIGSMITADRYAYLASVPVIALCVEGVTKLGLQQKYTFAFWLPIITVLSMMTWNRTKDWCIPQVLFEQAVDLYPNSGIAHMNLAGELIRTNQLNKAKAHLEAALSSDPDLIEALITASQLDLRTGNSAQAKERAMRAITLAPDFHSIHLAYLTLARLEKAAGKNEKALQHLAIGIQHNPSYSELYHEQGICHATLGDHRSAIVSYSMAVALGNSDPQLFLNLAISQGWLGDNESALHSLDKALSIAPLSQEGWFLKGVALNRTGRSGCRELVKAKSLGHPRAQEALLKLCK